MNILQLLFNIHKTVPDLILSFSTEEITVVNMLLNIPKKINYFKILSV